MVSVLVVLEDWQCHPKVLGEQGLHSGDPTLTLSQHLPQHAISTYLNPSSKYQWAYWLISSLPAEVGLVFDSLDPEVTRGETDAIRPQFICGPQSPPQGQHGLLRRRRGPCWSQGTCCLWPKQEGDSIWPTDSVWSTDRQQGLAMGDSGR